MRYDCEHCGAALKVEARERTATCPYCASPHVLERPSPQGGAEPTFAIGFALTREGARRAVSDWARTRSAFAHSGVKHAGIEDIRGVYMPAGLYSALARSSYSASIGEDYTETETYTITDREGRKQTRTRTVTRTEYRPLRGEHATYVTDVLVPASRGVSNAELEAVEPYDLRAMRRYTPGLVSGWIVEEPTRTMEEIMLLARHESLRKLNALLPRFMPGDRHKDFHFRTDLERVTSDPILLPLWILAVRHDPQRPPLRVLINGQTGKVFGEVPLSPWKFLVVVAVVLLILLFVIVLLVGGRG